MCLICAEAAAAGVAALVGWRLWLHRAIHVRKTLEAIWKTYLT